MPYKVALRKNETGETRFRVIDWDWFKNGEGGDHYWWTQGNFQCDCNRELEFERAAGNDPDLNDTHCSDGRFTAIYAELPDGTRIVLDDSDSPC